MLTIMPIIYAVTALSALTLLVTHSARKSTTGINDTAYKTLLVGMIGVLLLQPLMTASYLFAQKHANTVQKLECNLFREYNLLTNSDTPPVTVENRSDNEKAITLKLSPAWIPEQAYIFEFLTEAGSLHDLHSLALRTMEEGSQENLVAKLGKSSFTPVFYELNTDSDTDRVIHLKCSVQGAPSAKTILNRGDFMTKKYVFDVYQINTTNKNVTYK